MVTCTNGTGARPAGGVVTPGTDAGNVTATWFDAVLAVRPLLLYPFRAAYSHGVAGSPGAAAQTKDVPTVYPGAGLGVPCADISKSMAQAWHAASAAPCAFCRLKNRFVMSTAKPIKPIRKIA